MLKLLFLVMYFVNLIMALVDQCHGNTLVAGYDMLWAILMYLLYKDEK